MKKGLFLLLIGLILFTGCAAPAAPAETPTATTVPPIRTTAMLRRLARCANFKIAITRYRKK